MDLGLEGVHVLITGRFLMDVFTTSADKVYVIGSSGGIGIETARLFLCACLFLLDK